VDCPLPSGTVPGDGFPDFDVDVGLLKCLFELVFVALEWTYMRTFSSWQFTEKDLSRESSFIHSHDMAWPSESVTNDDGFDAPGPGSSKDGIVGDVILPIDSEQLTELPFMKLLEFLQITTV